jgi:peptidoglycan/xylan/chitin deacetylase (PgdA/CDA1 family)
VLEDRDLPGATFVVTFDDGYVDNLHNAQPILERDDVPATVFVTTGFLGSDRAPSWDELEVILRGPAPLPAELRATVLFTALPEASQRWEIGESKRRLESLLGEPVTSFAYPDGHHTVDLAALAQEAGYSSACSIHPGPLYRQSNRFRLPRLKVGDWDGDRLARVLGEWFG